MTDWYTMGGEKLELMEGARYMERIRRDGTFRVGLTKLPWGGEVSTVFLGLDHSFTGGVPICWESMVFPPGSFSDLDSARYASRAEAEVGHAALVKQWQHVTPRQLKGCYLSKRKVRRIFKGRRLPVVTPARRSYNLRRGARELRAFVKEQG